MKSNPYGNNSRNMPAGDTTGELMEPSATPFVSPTPGGLPQGFDGPAGSHCLATMGTAVFVDGDDVSTRFKYGPANQGGDVSIDGGTP